MTKRNGFVRVGFAALSAVLVWLARRVVRASGPFIASGHRGPARLILAVAKALDRASERAAAVAFPKVHT